MANKSVKKCVLVPTVSDGKVCSLTNTTNPSKENKEETSSCLKSVNNKVLKVFHQNIKRTEKQNQ